MHYIFKNISLASILWKLVQCLDMYIHMTNKEYLKTIPLSYILSGYEMYSYFSGQVLGVKLTMWPKVCYKSRN